MSTYLVAVEANYHKRCYVSFRRREKSDERHSSKIRMTDEEGLLYGTVQAELAEYIQDLYIFSDTSPVLKLSLVTNLFEVRMRPLVLKILACTEQN
ncbi:hypothetical protein AVEN_97217-1 [Araneus ventricosus]|uniref:Uncharacterized protein n=1 Tax=Araneus ventricosus TaxID=182803 RepID=A0A4Y2GCE9_ARAVE|nr:hypothetical protein AVEN_97217-1 [Araneus ventricosus]